MLIWNAFRRYIVKYIMNTRAVELDSHLLKLFWQQGVAIGGRSNSTMKYHYLIARNN